MLVAEIKYQRPQHLCQQRAASYERSDYGMLETESFNHRKNNPTVIPSDLSPNERVQLLTPLTTALYGNGHITWGHAWSAQFDLNELMREEKR